MSLFNKAVIVKYLPLALLLITINSHGLHTLKLGSTFFWWVIQFIVLLFFWIVKNTYTPRVHQNKLLFLRLYLGYVLISFVRGLFIASTYWDWKGLVSNTMCLLIPIAAFALGSIYLLQHIIKHYLFYTAPLFLVFCFFIGKDEFGFYLAPFSFLLLFFPLVSNKWKLILLSVSLFVIFADFGARSNVLKFIVPFLLSLIIYFRNIFVLRLFQFLRLLLLVSPFVFLILAAKFNFNIFNPNKDKHKPIIANKTDANGQKIEEDLAADTRTFIYREVIFTANKYNSWFFGRSPARGNVSETFGYLDVNRRNERLWNEVSILNYFTWIGLIGVVLIFIIFIQATNLAINHSNNIVLKIIGIFISFRWAYAWVEDINNFYIQYIYLWLFIGVCFSEPLRKMNNKEIKKWVVDIFSLKKNVKAAA
jgi:hypothetical protein